MLVITYIDDVPGEVIGHVIDKIIKHGASNIHVVPSITKKNRPGYILFIDVSKESIDRVIDILIKDYGILGYRVVECRHYSIPYTVEKVSIIYRGSVLGAVSVKKIVSNGNVLHVKAEYEDLRRVIETIDPLEEKVSLAKLKTLVETAVLNNSNVVKLDS